MNKHKKRINIIKEKIKKVNKKESIIIVIEEKVIVELLSSNYC